MPCAILQLQDAGSTATISLSLLITGSIFASTSRTLGIEVPELTATAVS